MPRALTSPLVRRSQSTVLPEIYFGILQRKVLAPPDATSLGELANRIAAFERAYERLATPFEWRFTRADLSRLLGRLGQCDATSLAPAA